MLAMRSNGLWGLCLVLLLAVVAISQTSATLSSTEIDALIALMDEWPVLEADHGWVNPPTDACNTLVGVVCSSADPLPGDTVTQLYALSRPL